MDFRYLKAFYLTAKHQSFTKAAEELRIAQSAVSRQISLLEESLDFQLLIRGSAGVTLTPKGKELYNQLHVFNEWSVGFEEQSVELVRIASMEGVAAQWLPERLSKLAKPTPRIEITVGSSTTVRKLIENAEVDLALSIEKIDTANVSSVKLFKETLVAVSKDEIDIDKIHEVPWIFLDKASHLTKVTRKHPKHYIRAGSVPLMMEMVRQGFGVAITAEHLLGPKDNKLKRYQLPQLRESAIYLSSLNYEIVPAGVTTLRKVLMA